MCSASAAVVLKCCNRFQAALNARYIAENGTFASICSRRELARLFHPCYSERRLLTSLHSLPSLSAYDMMVNVHRLCLVV